MRKHKQWIIAAVTLALAAAPFAGAVFKDHDLIYAKPYAAEQVAADIPDEEEEAMPVFGTTPLKVGSSGQDVYELQGRLKHLGYFNGKIDSQFGTKTKNAVTWFQWKFGLKSDGVVGAKTKLKLYNATTSWKPTAPETTTAQKKHPPEQLRPNPIRLSWLPAIRWACPKMTSRSWQMRFTASLAGSLLKGR